MAEAVLAPVEKKQRRRKRKLRATHYVFFGDKDTNKVGAGWRCICLVKLGTKYAHLYYPADDQYFKVGVRDWQRLERLGHKMDAKGKRLASST